MANILVVTFTNAVDNYGQVLQYYATQEFLSKRGHRVSVHYDKVINTPMWRRIASRIKRMILPPPPQVPEPPKVQPDTRTPEEKAKLQIFKQWQESIDRNELLHPRKFQDFKKRHFNILRCPISRMSSLKLDACVVGSDQTWSWVSNYNFLAWAPSGAKKISIAPSVGHKQFSEAEIQRASDLLKDFDLITVREDNGLEFCQKAGHSDAQKILDPTFLLSSDDYRKIEKPHGITKPYILLYLLGGEIDIEVSEIYEFAKKEGLDVVYVASQGREDDYPKYYAEVGQWLSLIRDAKYVFTNSFHGMAFSIIYHKQFLVFPLVGLMKGMNGRINNLAEIFSISNNLFCGSLGMNSVCVEYTDINQIINENKSILDNNLKKINL